MIKEERLQSVRKLYAKGMDDRQISDAIGISKSAVRRARNILELPAIGVSRPVRQKKVTDAQLVEWVAEGITLAEMASRGSVAYSTIHKRLLRMRINRVTSRDANREAAEPACQPADKFLAAFKPGLYLPPTHSRMAETANRDGSRIIGLPVAICTASSLYGA